MHTFYNTDLDLNTKTSILKDSIDVCDKYRVDILNCSKSFARQRTELTFDDVLPKFTDGCHFVVIEREDFLTKKHYGEIGFSELGQQIEHFLFIYLSLENLQTIISKYNLKQIQ